MGLFLALLLMWAGQQPVNADNGSLDGIVLRYGTTQPVTEAQVYITASTAAAAIGNTTSDASGKFRFENIPPGQYAVVARRDEYVGAGSQGRPETAITLTLSKQEHHDVVLTMIPTSTISGKITLPKGPAARISVEAVQETFTRMGRPALRLEKSVTTNDRGEYRLFGIPPGDYYIRVSRQTAGGSFPGQGNSFASKDPTAASTYYPGKDDFESAIAIHVKVGVEVSGIDFPLGAVSNGVTVSGKISGTIPPPEQGATVATGFYLVPHNPDIGSGSPTQIRGPILISPGGEFELHNVLPGIHDLYAFIRYAPDSSNNVGALRGGTFNFIGRATIDVSTQDIHDVSIPIRPGVEAKGRVTVNGEDPKGRVGNALVGLSPFDSMPFSLLTIGDGPTGLARVDRETGNFTLTNIPAGVYRAAYGTILPPDAYVASASIGGKDVLGKEISIGNTSPGFLEVDVETPGAVVQGIVLDAQHQPVRGAAVALVPEKSKRGIFFRYGSATTDENGRFTIRGIAPGDYKIFAQAYGTVFEWMNPNFISKFEPSGIDIQASTAGPTEVSVVLMSDDN